MSWIPRGSFCLVRPEGMVIDGDPVRLHGELKEASPVFSRPLRAGVVVAGVMRQS